MQNHYRKALGSIVPQTLYIVATPIGNLADITLRALAVLSAADLICAEDTRMTARLLHAYGLQKKLLSVREQNEQAMAEKIVDVLRGGGVVAQVSDAGTPAICDPGARLSARVRAEGFSVLPVPGAAAVTAVLSVAGVVQSDFYFAGFLPAKSGERRQLLAGWQHSTVPVVVYETPHRIVAALNDMADLLPGRELFFAREVSKTYEDYLQGTVEEVRAAVLADANRQRGEMVLVLKPGRKAETAGLPEAACKVMAVLAQELPLKQAASLAAQISGAGKKALYDWMLVQKRREEETDTQV